MKLIVLGCDGAAGMWQYAFSQTGMEGRLTGSRDMQEEAKHEELLRMLREGWDLCLLYGSHSDSVTEKLIGRLPEELRSVVILRFFSGYTQAETAAALNIPQGTAATRQKRALALLKLELGEEGQA